MHDAVMRSISEKAFQQQVIQAAELLGWKCYHVPDSRRVTSAGYPDLTLVHPTRGFFLAELKTERGRIRPEQQQWLDALRACGVEVHVFRPRDWERIVQRLQHYRA